MRDSYRWRFENQYRTDVERCWAWIYWPHSYPGHCFISPTTTRAIICRLNDLKKWRALQELKRRNTMALECTACRYLITKYSTQVIGRQNHRRYIGIIEPVLRQMYVNEKRRRRKNEVKSGWKVDRMLACAKLQPTPPSSGIMFSFSNKFRLCNSLRKHSRVSRSTMRWYCRTHRIILSVNVVLEDKWKLIIVILFFKARDGSRPSNYLQRTNPRQQMWQKFFFSSGLRIMNSGETWRVAHSLAKTTKPLMRSLLVTP